MGRTKLTALKSDPVGAAHLNALHVARQLREVGHRVGIREFSELEDINFEVLQRGGLSPIALAWFNSEARGRIVFIYPIVHPYAGLPTIGYRIE